MAKAQKSQDKVLNLLSKLQAEMGLGILIITHNLHVVRHVADRMAIMYLGRFIERGDTERIFRQPGHPCTAALLGANPSPDPDAVRQGIESCSLHPSWPVWDTGLGVKDRRLRDANPGTGLPARVPGLLDRVQLEFPCTNHANSRVAGTLCRFVAPDTFACTRLT